MPGPGQGKRRNKKKWRENTLNMNANITAINVVMATDLLTKETGPNMASYTAAQTNAVTTTAGAATNNASDVTHIDTAAATLPANDETSQPLLFTYSHEEVQLLLEDARLEGYQEGFEEGHRMGRKTGHEEGKEDGYEEGYNEGSRKWGEGYREGYEAKGKLNQEKEERVRKEGLLKGYELGTQQGKDEKQ